MIKRVLVTLDTSNYAKMATHYACSLAKSRSAVLTGIIVLDFQEIEKNIGPVPLGGSYYAQKLEKFKKDEAQKAMSKQLDEFRNICKQNNVDCNVSKRQGIPSDKIIEEAKFYDLIVSGLKTFYHFETTDKAGNSIEKIMNHSSTPILAVPQNFNLFNNNKFSSLLCFDGSIPSVRALHNLVDTFKPNETDITILMSNENEDTSKFLLNEAKQYVQSYGFDNVKTIFKTENIKDIIFKDFYNNYDLIAIGAHSKNSIMDFITGSLCKSLIDKALKPLLIGL